MIIYLWDNYNYMRDLISRWIFLELKYQRTAKEKGINFWMLWTYHTHLNWVSIQISFEIWNPAETRYFLKDIYLALVFQVLSYINSSIVFIATDFLCL